jgi:hypothetical protein
MKESFPKDIFISILVLTIAIAIHLYSYVSAKSKTSSPLVDKKTYEEINLDLLKDPVLEEILAKNKNGDVPVQIREGDLAGY